MISQNTDATILKDYENEYFAKLLLSWASSPPRPNFLMDGLEPSPSPPFPLPHPFFSFASYAVIQREVKNCFCTSQFNLIISFLEWLAFSGS